MSVLINGMLFGLILSLFVGPVFFALIQTSIEKGFSAGVGMALGVSISDTIYIFITYLGISQLLNTSSFKFLLSAVGGIILLLFGIYSFIRPTLSKKMVNTDKNQNFFYQIAKGVILNGINPSVLLFWIGVVSLSSAKYHYAGNNIYLFFIAILGTVLMIDVLKSYLANKLSIFVTAHFIKIMNRVVGIALMAFALQLFYQAYAMTLS